MNRSDMRTYIRSLLGVESTDKLYTDTRLNSFLEQAHYSILDTIQKAAPRYFQKTTTVVLVAREATLPSDFSKALEVRLSTSSGAEYNEVLLEDLGNTAVKEYSISAQDDAAKIHAGPGSGATDTLWIRYQYWPTAFTTDVAPTGLPPAFHEVVALEAIFVFELGAEAELPPTIRQRWQERRAALITHVSDRTVQPTRVTSPTSRAGLRALLRTMLGVSERDEVYTDARLNIILLNAHKALVADIQDSNPSYLSRSGTLTRLSARKYQAPTDLARFSEVRYNTFDGEELTEVRADDLFDAGLGTYAVVDDVTDGLVIVTSPASVDAPTLFARWAYWPAALDSAYEGLAPDGIPIHYVDVVALEALFVTPGAQEKNPQQYERWVDRRSQLMSRIGRMTNDPLRQRVREPFDADNI